MENFRVRSVIADVPPLADYAPFLEQVHASGRFSNFGPLAERLEAALLEAFGAPDECCISCGNATAGLTAALLASGRSGAAIVPAFTFPASLGAVRAAGMAPLIVDVEAGDWALAAAPLAHALEVSGAGAVMLVAPFGIARDWDEEIAVCRRYGAAVVIDNASGLGGPRRTRAAEPDVFEVVSLHATKPFAIGEGGAIFAHRSREAALRGALNFGLASQARPEGPRWGFNGKMSELHAAVGLAQMRRFPAALARRQTYAASYLERLRDFPEVGRPHEARAAAWQFFPVLLPDGGAAERFIAAAAQRDMEIRRYYRPSLSQWREADVLTACPVAENLADRMCVLPVRGLAFDLEAEDMAELVTAALADAL